MSFCQPAVPDTCRAHTRGNHVGTDVQNYARVPTGLRALAKKPKTMRAVRGGVSGHAVNCISMSAQRKTPSPANSNIITISHTIIKRYYNEPYVHYAVLQL